MRSWYQTQGYILYGNTYKCTWLGGVKHKNIFYTVILISALGGEVACQTQGFILYRKFRLKDRKFIAAEDLVKKTKHLAVKCLAKHNRGNILLGAVIFYK